MYLNNISKDTNKLFDSNSETITDISIDKSKLIINYNSITPPSNFTNPSYLPPPPTALCAPREDV